MLNLPLSILDSNELYTTSKRIHAILNSDLSGDNYVVSLCGKLVRGTTNVEKALGKVLSSDFTPVLLKKDEIRDNSFVSLRDYVKSLVHSKDATKALAAIKLSEIIQSLGNGLYNLGYLDETSKLNSLLTALKAAEITEALNIIGATGLFAELEADQKDFEQTYQSKVDAEAAINLPLLKDAKALLAKTLKAALIYVESNVELDAAKFGPIEQKLNEIITDVVAIGRARITRVANEKKKVAEQKVG